jgi:hypothetical protein
MTHSVVITIYGQEEETQELNVLFSEPEPVPGNPGKYEVEEITVLNEITIEPGDLNTDIVDGICFQLDWPVGSIIFSGKKIECTITAEETVKI